MSTLGDTIIKEAAIEGQVAKLDKSQIEKNEKLLETMVDQDPNNKPTDVESIISVDRNDDGSIKWTFDKKYKNKKLASVAKDYYHTKINKSYNDKEALDKFIPD